MKQLNYLHGNEPNEPPIEWNIQPSEVHFKSWNSSTNTITVVSTIIGRINNDALDNGDVEIYPSENPFESTSDSVTYPDTTPIVE